MQYPHFPSSFKIPTFTKSPITSWSFSEYGYAMPSYSWNSNNSCALKLKSDPWGMERQQEAKMAYWEGQIEFMKELILKKL